MQCTHVGSSAGLAYSGAPLMSKLMCATDILILVKFCRCLSLRGSQFRPSRKWLCWQDCYPRQSALQISVLLQIPACASRSAECLRRPPSPTEFSLTGECTAGKNMLISPFIQLASCTNAATFPLATYAGCHGMRQGDGCTYRWHCYTLCIPMWLSGDKE